MTLAVASSAQHLAHEINAAFRLCKNTTTTAIKAALGLGRLLVRAREDVGRGRWRDWVEVNLAFGLRMAQRYVKLAENWDSLKDRLGRQVYDLESLAEALRVIADREEDEPPEPALEARAENPQNHRPLPIVTQPAQKKSPLATPPESSTKELSIALPLDLHLQLETIAKRQRATLKAVVEDALRRYVAVESKGAAS